MGRLGLTQASGSTPRSMLPYPLTRLKCHLSIQTSSPLFHMLDSELDSHLWAVAIFHVEVVAVSVQRKLKFVRLSPVITYPLSLCGHSAYKIHLTHINLKIVCLVTSSTRTPRAISSRFFQSAKEWRFILIVVRTRFHSVIWYRVGVTHAECFACCKGTMSIIPST